MPKRTRAMRRRDNDTLALKWGEYRHKDKIDKPLANAYATVQTVKYQSDGAFFKSRFEPKGSGPKKTWARD